MADKLVPLAFSSALVDEESDRNKAGVSEGRLWLSRSSRLLSDAATPEDFFAAKKAKQQPESVFHFQVMI